MRVSQVHKSVHRIAIPYGNGGAVFAYLMRGDSIALVDTGPAGMLGEKLQSALAEIGLTASDIDLILNTHGHMDHAGGNQELKAVSRATIHLHPGDLPMATSVDAQVELATQPFRVLGLPDVATQELADNIRRMAGTPAGVDTALTDGTIVDLGDGVRLRVVHSPGHTRGSVSYYWEEEGLLITGDAVQGQGARAGVFPLYSDAFDYRRSLSTMLQLDLRLLCLGHAFVGGGPINDPTREGDEVRAFLLDSERVADTIHEAVTGSLIRMPGASEGEVVREALSELAYHIPQLIDRQTGMPRWAGPTLLAHVRAAIENSYPSEGRQAVR